MHALLPVWLQKTWGMWTACGGGGYGINPGPGLQNYGFVGMVLQKQVLKPLLVGIEVYHQTAPEVDGRGDTAFNVGTVFDFSEDHHLLFSAGRSINGPTDFNATSPISGPSITAFSTSESTCRSREMETSWKVGQRDPMLKDWLLWALGSALFAALTAVLAKVGVTGISSNLATVIRTGVILVFGVGLLAFTGEGRGVWALGSRAWTFLVLSGLATGFSWLCYFRALQLGEASRVAPVDKLSVVFVLGLAGWFLGERLTWAQWLGGSLIFVGALVIAWKPD